MTFNTFHDLWQDVSEAHDLDQYIADRGWQDWMNEYGEENADQIIDVLTAIWKFVTEGFPSVRRHSGLTQAAFAEVFNIPKRSVENWDEQLRAAPEYVVMLLAYAVLTK